MKNKIAMLLMFVAITAINVYSIRYYTNKNSNESVNIKLDVSEFSRIEAKIDAVYEECKLRDSAIYRAVLEMREIITGLQTINERNSIAEL
tara:strand:+ start:389 stop:661 length:273 start_codon:yes stop_codon:yes gene_type:complete